MKFIQDTLAKAKKAKKTIVMPESYDPRILQAAEQIHTDGIAEIVLLGNPLEIADLAKKTGVDLAGINFLYSESDPNFSEYVEKFYQNRKEKGVTREDAYNILSTKDNLYYAGMLLKNKHVDGCVAGASNTTGDVIRAAIHTVGMKEGINRISSSIFVVTEFEHLGSNGVLLMADVAVNPDPDAQTLADIAVTSALTYEAVIDGEAKVAMLSFSTKGSASHPDVEKVQEATELAKSLNPDLNIDGELQIDPALDPRSARTKAPNSPVAGQANVLVFPDLGAANIGSKIPQVIGNARSIGPIVQGVASPFNDLSRNCTIEDVVVLTAMTCLMAD